jgi:hypothetical protein
VTTWKQRSFPEHRQRAESSLKQPEIIIMGLTEKWMPPSRENWELVVFLFQLFPVASRVSCETMQTKLIDAGNHLPMGSTMVRRRQDVWHEYTLHTRQGRVDYDGGLGDDFVAVHDVYYPFSKRHQRHWIAALGE